MANSVQVGTTEARQGCFFKGYIGLDCWVGDNARDSADTVQHEKFSPAPSAPELKNNRLKKKDTVRAR